MVIEYTLPYTTVEINEKIDMVDEISNDKNAEEIPSLPIVKFVDYDKKVKTISHRGYNAEAPENTIPAFILSKQKGYNYVECDVFFTSDNVAVLLHDDTIDRTSNGSGNISSLTYEEVLQYDFGSWKSSLYKGVKIPTFKQFILLCKDIDLHPYIELKDCTQEQAKDIVIMVEEAGMKGRVTYTSFDSNILEYIKNIDKEARLGYTSFYGTKTEVNTALGLKTDVNEVFVTIRYYEITDSFISLCKENNLPLEIWCVNDKDVIKNMDDYITGVTSDNLMAGKILCNKSENIVQQWTYNLSFSNTEKDKNIRKQIFNINFK